MVVPDVKGGNNQLYWGEQRFSGGAFYFGALAFALCLAWLIAGSRFSFSSIRKCAAVNASAIKPDSNAAVTF